MFVVVQVKELQRRDASPQMCNLPRSRIYPFGELEEGS